MKITINSIEYECTKAVKGDTYIFLYDENDQIINSFVGNINFDEVSISGGDWTLSPEQQTIAQMTADNADRDELIAELLEGE